MKHKLLVVLGSIREGRRGIKVAEWFLSIAEKDDRFEVTFADLAEYDLPFAMEFTEPSEHQDKKYPNAKIQKWSDTVDSSKAIVFILPEYNHAAPAVLKNAIDQIYYEWRDKSVGFIGYGGRGGARDAIDSLRYTARALEWKIVQPIFGIKKVKQAFDPNGQLIDDQDYKVLADLMLNDIARQLSE